MSSRQLSNSANDPNQRLRLLRVYTACVSALGGGLLFWSLSRLFSAPSDALLFVGLIALAELTTFEVFTSQLLLSISSAVTFASLLLFGPVTAGLVAMVGGLVITLVGERRRTRSGNAPLLQRALFNAANYGLSVAIGGGIYLIVGGRIGKVDLYTNLIPAVLAAVITEIMNSGLVVGAVAFQTDQSPLHIWKQNVSWAIPMNCLGMVVGGGGLAYAYQVAGVFGMIVFFLPVVLSIYAYRLYVERTKAQLARLDEMVAERVNALREAKQQVDVA